MPEPSVAPALPPWWLHEAPLGESFRRRPLARGRGRRRRGGRRRRVHGALDGARAYANASRRSAWQWSRRSSAGSDPSGRNGGFLHGYWSWLRASRASSATGALALARAGDRVVAAVGAFCVALGEDVWLTRGGLLRVSAAPAQDAAVDRRRRRRRARRGGGGGGAFGGGGGWARRSPRFRRGAAFPGRRHRAACRLVRALRRSGERRGSRRSTSGRG